MNYFTVYQDYFWTLEEDGEVIAVNGGGTIAYSQFVVQVLEYLAYQGLPPLGSLLLAIIATNHSEDDLIAQISDTLLYDHPTMTDEEYAHMRENIEELTLSSMSFLRLLQSLPSQYTTGNRRIQLFQLLFADCHGILSKTDSRQIIDGIRQLRDDGNSKVVQTLSSLKEFDSEVFYKEYFCIAQLLKKFPDKDTIVEKLAGIPAIEEPILEEEEEARPAPGDFVEALTDNPATFPIGVLIKSLWSGMNIPIHHSLPTAQPLGGFSDLSNKGDLDKLLISEFATDEWLFMSRLANNEALYLHREMPPSADPMERIILIDVSLKSWGTPRILAYAILLAIARHPKTDIPCTAYAVGNNFYPVQTGTVEEVIQSIQLVDGALHPAGGLVQFFDSGPGPKRSEVFFISSPDTMRHSEVQKVFSDNYSRFKYWVTASHDGELSFYRNQHKGRRLVQRLKLPLQQLWESRKWGRKEDPQEELEPGKLRIPILFPPPTSPKKFFVSSEFDLFAVTKERNLLRHSLNERAGGTGWQLVMEQVPPSTSHFAMGPEEDGKQLFLSFKVHNRELTICQLATGESRSIFFNEWKPSRFPDFFFMEQEFHYMNDHECWSFSFQEEIRVQKHVIGGDNRFISWYETLQQRTETGKSGISFTWSVLKNIHHICINQQGNLVFNKHELVLNRSGHLQLLSASQESRGIAATAGFDREQNEFVFPGGSKIKVHRSGMIILQGVGDRSPRVYIPAALDASLAAATHVLFSGNMYYYPKGQNEPLIKVSVPGFYEENIRSFIQHVLQCS